MVNNKDINRRFNSRNLCWILAYCWQRQSTKQEHGEFAAHPVWRQTSTWKEWLCWHDKRTRVSLCSHWNRAWLEWHPDRTDKCKWEVWLFVWGKCDWAFIKWKLIDCYKCQFSDDYWNHTDAMEVLRISRRARTLRDEKQDDWCERQVCSASHHKPVKKQKRSRKWRFIAVGTEKLWRANLMISFSISTARNAFCNTGSSNRIAKRWLPLKMRQCSSSQTGLLSTQKSWNSSRVVSSRWPQLLSDILTLFEMVWTFGVCQWWI